MKIRHASISTAEDENVNREPALEVARLVKPVERYDGVNNHKQSDAAYVILQREVQFIKRVLSEYELRMPTVKQLVVFDRVLRDSGKYSCSLAGLLRADGYSYYQGDSRKLLNVFEALVRRGIVFKRWQVVGGRRVLYWGIGRAGRALLGLWYRYLAGEFDGEIGL